MAAEIEVKRSYARIFIEADALKALWQILRGSCGAAFEADGFEVLRYGVSFLGKGCRAVLGGDVAPGLIQYAAASAPRRELERARDDASRTLSDLESLRKRLFP
ncbi:MAG: hypothetical protein LBU32_26175 [Clostridiales bacterium]|jgi:hypothetical protein|nr:hypothetical protein [Clostridiales bacterium]